MKRPLFLILQISLILLFSETQMTLASEKGNGGEAEKLKFAIVANRVFSLIQENSPQFPEIDLTRLRVAVQNTKIQFTHELLILDDVSVVAINEPKNGVIRVNRFKWRGLSGKPTLQTTIVAHEYFGMIGLNDSNGQISSKVAALLGESPMAFFRWSCSAVATDYIESGLGRKLYVLGEGETAGEAWIELLEAAELGIGSRFHLTRSTEKQLGVPYLATMTDSCVKND